VALLHRLLHDKTPDASGGADYEHSETLALHAGTISSIRAQGVQCARIANEGQELGRNVDQALAIVPDAEVRSDVSLDLRITAAECSEHAEGQELARGDVDPPRATQSPKQLADRKCWMCC
jgi:hypothetical protein